MRLWQGFLVFFFSFFFLVFGLAARAFRLPSEFGRYDVPVAGTRLLGFLRLGLVRIALPLLLLVVIGVFAFCGFVLLDALVLVLDVDGSSGVSVSPSASPSLSSTITIAWVVFSSSSSSSSSFASFASCFASCLDLHLQARFSWLSGLALLLSFRVANTCLLALEPGRSSTLGVVVAFFQVGLVPGIHTGPGEPHGHRACRASGATAELPPDW